MSLHCSCYVAEMLGFPVRPRYPQHVLDLHPSAITVQAVARPNDKSIWVNLDRVTLCPVKLPDESWLRQKL